MRSDTLVVRSNGIHHIVKDVDGGIIKAVCGKQIFPPYKIVTRDYSSICSKCIKKSALGKIYC